MYGGYKRVSDLSWGKSELIYTDKYDSKLFSLSITSQITGPIVDVEI